MAGIPHLAQASEVVLETLAGISVRASLLFAAALEVALVQVVNSAEAVQALAVALALVVALFPVV